MAKKIKWLKGANQLVVDVVEYVPADGEGGQGEKFLWSIVPAIGLKANNQDDDSAADVYICLRDQIQTTIFFQNEYYISCNVRNERDELQPSTRDIMEQMAKDNWLESQEQIGDI